MQETIVAGFFGLGGVILGVLLSWATSTFDHRYERTRQRSELLEARRRVERSYWAALYRQTATAIEDGGHLELAEALAPARRTYQASVMGDPPEGDLPHTVKAAVESVRTTVIQNISAWEDALIDEGDGDKTGEKHRVAINAALDALDKAVTTAK